MRLLVIRTSAMGDVALTTPVLRALSEQYPGTEVVMLTRPLFNPFFHSIPGLILFNADFDTVYKGLPGIIRLYKDLRRDIKPDMIIDLHDVLRSRLLRLLFAFSGIRAKVIVKGRREKKLLITGKKKQQLKHSVERYCDVFAAAGFPLVCGKGPWIIPDQVSLEAVSSLLGSGDGLRIGVAPFARHELKMWPVDYMITLLGRISGDHNARFFLFGGRDETEKLGQLGAAVKNAVNTAGKLRLQEEIALMSRLDLMIAMDSSNMHMAALTGIKVVSLWGGTDRLGGFGAWMQPSDHFISIEVDKLACRPCTIYGKGKCSRGDLACMNWLTPDIVYGRIRKFLVKTTE